MYNKEENNNAGTRNFTTIKICQCSMVVSVAVMAIVFYFIFDGDFPLSPAVQLYVETGDILISLFAVYVLIKWFHIPFLRTLLAGEATDAVAKLQSMSITRYALWESLCIVNIFLWRFFGVNNALYILIILVVAVAMMLPLDANLQRDCELLSK